MAAWPEWWQWELELTPHLERRMAERGIDELTLRAILQTAKGWHPVELPGRYAIVAMHKRSDWRIIVEPDPSERVLVVVTAYRVEAP